MKLKEKILIGVSVFFLAIIFILLFIWIFHFEGKREEQPSIISDEYVENLYQNIVVDENYTYYTYYNGFLSRFNNLASSFVSNMAYNYLKSNNELTINLAKNELPNALLAEISDLDQIVPKYKISLETFNKAIKYLYGEEVKITNESFNIDGKTKAYYTPKENYIFVYEINEIVEEPYYVYRTKESYEVRDNKETLVIYDHFIKCDKSNGLCYNDSKMSIPNRSITYSNGTLNGSLTNLARYKHTYKLEGDHFIWQSSDLIDN